MYSVRGNRDPYPSCILGFSVSSVSFHNLGRIESGGEGCLKVRGFFHLLWFTGWGWWAFLVSICLVLLQHLYKEDHVFKIPEAPCKQV